MRNTTGPLAALYKAVIAGAAGYRNQRHSENVRLGRARQRTQVEAAGEQYQHGRPTDLAVVTRVCELTGPGPGRRHIAAATGVAVGTVQHYLTEVA
ncbi:MAG: hypothetical protein ACRYFK_06025 [Janthinobacterium lividum]